MSLAQWSNLLVYAAMAMYALAMLAFAGSFAAVRADRQGGGRPVDGAGARPVGRHARSLEESAEVVGVAARSGRGAVPGGVGAGGSGGAPGPGAGGAGGPRRAGDDIVATTPGRRAGNIGLSLTWLALGLLVAALVARGLWAQRAPWGNMYEYSLASAAAITGTFLVVSRRRDVRWLGLPVSMASLVTLGVAVLLLYNDSPQLVPALKSYWLVIHVAAAIISGGAFTVGAAATMLYLAVDRAERDLVAPPELAAGIRGRARAATSRVAGALAARLPGAGELDALSYRVNAFVFPLWTFAVIAGAIWAEDAWGRYWGWDPKETWAFITWLVYAGYLHARATAGWRGRRAAVVALIGFAAFLINFFGVNLFVSGLHSYAGV